jgi:predicted component of type VI protein secretion system
MRLARLLIVTLLGFLPFLTGCFEAKKSDEVTFLIRTTPSTNHGTPLYVVIKETTMAEFLTQDYNEIATQSFWKEEDSSQLVKKVLIPGTTNKIQLESPKGEKSLGVYFLFTNPGECWKYILDKPTSEKVKILLGEEEYKAVNVFSR